MRLINESINSNILKDIINNKQNISFFNQFQYDSDTYKACNDLMKKLKSLYKLLTPPYVRDSKNAIYFSTIYQEIKPYHIKELGKTKDEIVLYINNINKTVYQLNMQLNRIINSSIDPYILLQNFITRKTDNDLKSQFNLDLIQDSDFEKYTYKEATKDISIYQKIKKALLVFYFDDNNKILGVSSKDSLISKYSTYNNDRYINEIKNIDKSKHIITLCTIQDLPVLGLNLELLNNLTQICNNTSAGTTINDYDYGVRKGIVLNSILNKKNRLYTELNWGMHPTDYCYICSPSENILSTKDISSKRKERYKDTDTKKRYKWKQDEFGNFKRYVPVITKYNAHLEELKDISIYDTDQYNTELFKSNQENLEKKCKNLRLQKQISANKIERNQLIDKVQECNNKFLEYLNKNQNNDSENFNFELHNKVQEIAQDIQRLQQLVNTYIQTINNFIKYQEECSFFDRRTPEQCKSAKDDVERQIDEINLLLYTYTRTI